MSSRSSAPRKPRTMKANPRRSYSINIGARVSWRSEQSQMPPNKRVTGLTKKSTKVLNANTFGNCSADFLHIWNMIDGVHLLDVFRFQMAHAKTMETVCRKLRIITQVSEDLAARAFVARETFLEIALVD